MLLQIAEIRLRKTVFLTDFFARVQASPEAKDRRERYRG